MLMKDNHKCTWYGEVITEAEYNEIPSMLRSRPEVSEGCAYRLTKALVWEQYEYVEVVR